MNNAIETRLEKIEIKIEEILSLLKNDVKPNCDKMNSHISFIEGIYDKLQYPLEVVANRINSLNYITSIKLPLM